MSDSYMPEVVERALPGSLRAIAGLIGAEKTMLVVAEFGGTDLYIPTPERLDHAHRLTAAIGIDAALALAQHYSSEVLHIARAAAVVRALRNANIQIDYQAGMSKPELARRYVLDVRQIRTILRKAEM